LLDTAKEQKRLMSKRYISTVKEIADWVHDSEKYSNSTQEEQKEIDDKLSKISRRILGLQQTNENLKEKIEKYYRNIPW
jgi:uncharacterized protein YacL